MSERCPPIKWDSDAWCWVDAVTGEPLTLEEAEALGLDGSGRILA